MVRTIDYGVEIDEWLADVQIENAWDLVLAFSRQPQCLPDNVVEAANEIAARLRSWGVPVILHQAEIYLSIPISASVVSSAGGLLAAKAAVGSRSVPRGVTGAIIHVPAPTARTRAARFDRNYESISSEKVKGKIVVSNGFVSPGKVMEFEEKGASGFIAINPGERSHWGSCTSIWGSPSLNSQGRRPRIPVVSVNKEVGDRLLNLAEKGTVITLKTEMREGWHVQPIPVVMIEGALEPERFVLLHGHYDSWDVGVGDNGTGAATLLEIARVVHQRRSTLRRSVHIAWWPGHSTGKFAGSAWYADNFALELDEGCIAHVNCDSPGCRWATEYSELAWTIEAEGYVKSMVNRATGLAATGGRPHRGADYSFSSIGITGLLQQSSIIPERMRIDRGFFAVGGCGGNVEWHTEADLLDIADCTNLERDLKLYLAVVVGLANAEVLPFDWREAVNSSLEMLSHYEDPASGWFDLTPTRYWFTRLGNALSVFYKAVDAGGISPVVANTAIIQLGRRLIPIDYSKSERFDLDPALPLPQLPKLAEILELSKKDENDKAKGRVDLSRHQNQICANLREATRLVEEILASRRYEDRY